jgi:hypothetical protein
MKKTEQHSSTASPNIFGVGAIANESWPPVKRGRCGHCGNWRCIVSAAKTFILLLCLAFATVTNAGTVTLAWDPSPSVVVGTNGGGSYTNYFTITNYTVYYGVASATYTNTVLAGANLMATVSNLLSGPTYYFAATATDDEGLESDYSSEVSTEIPLAPPTGLIIFGNMSGGGIHL